MFLNLPGGEASISLEYSRCRSISAEPAGTSIAAWRRVRVAVLLAILGLSFQVLMSNACARRHYAMTVREVVPSPAPRRTETFRGPADFRNSDHAEASNAGGQLGSA